jgi:hypothetical protein
MPRSRSRSRSPVRIKLQRGTLSQYGYKNISTMTIKRRRVALKGAIGEYSALSIFHKLNALYVMNKNRNPETARLFNSDKAWVKANYLTPEKKRVTSARSRTPSRSRSPVRKARARYVLKSFW